MQLIFFSFNTLDFCSQTKRVLCLCLLRLSVPCRSCVPSERGSRRISKRGMTPRRNIELSELQKLFHLTEKQVAKELGVCLTSLKKICRQHGIHRWPYRKVSTTYPITSQLAEND